MVGIQAIQERVGHNDVKTTMIYTHVLNRGPAGVTAAVVQVKGRNDNGDYTQATDQ